MVLRINLIDENSKFKDNANLALRKIKAYYKAKGQIIDFNLSDPDITYISQVFPNNGKEFKIERYSENVEIGGPGYDVKKLLSPEIEHTCPDYDGLNFSMGRTSWGCPRKCPFCMTWRMEGTKTIEHSEFDEFVRHNKIILFDANFLKSPNKIKKLERIIDEGWRVSFTQGLDIRLINSNIAELLRELKTRDYKFKENRIYFAWDRLCDEKTILRNLQLLIDSGVKPSRLMFYVLTGFDTTLDEDIYRFKKLIEYDVDPFIMIYNNRRDIPEIRHWGRYVNKRFYKARKQTVEEYITEHLSPAPIPTTNKFVGILGGSL